MLLNAGASHKHAGHDRNHVLYPAKNMWVISDRQNHGQIMSPTKMEYNDKIKNT